MIYSNINNQSYDLNEIEKFEAIRISDILNSGKKDQETGMRRVTEDTLDDHTPCKTASAFDVYITKLSKNAKKVQNPHREFISTGDLYSKFHKIPHRRTMSSMSNTIEIGY